MSQDRKTQPTDAGVERLDEVDEAVLRELVRRSWATNHVPAVEA